MGQPSHGDGHVQGSNLEVRHTESFRPWDAAYCPWIQNKPHLVQVLGLVWLASEEIILDTQLLLAHLS